MTTSVEGGKHFVYQWIMRPCIAVPRRTLAGLAWAAGLLAGCGGSSEDAKASNVGSDGGGFVDAAADVSSDSGPGPSDAAQEGACSAQSCADLGLDCGSALDGCGGVIDCGSCPSGQTCGAAGPNLCGAGNCSPKTCAQLGASCGLVSDWCASVIPCGECAPGEVCGGAGIPNQCACKPTLSCVSAAAQCGTIDDGCGNVLPCGTCADPLVCEENACVCHPKTCADYAADCGTLPDGCGDELSCGTCSAGEICGGDGPNRCGPEPCEPKTCASYGFECGSFADGCGGAMHCGSCTSPETCGGAGTYGECGCSPLSCDAYGLCAASSLNPESTHDEPDGCGSVIACGKCCKNGTFCAGWGHTVEWQCGCGDPGTGWVSQGNDCYHHDTGSECP